MAVELEKFIREQLSALPLNHPDRKFLSGVGRVVDAYVDSSNTKKQPEIKYIKTTDTEEQIALGKRISEAFLGSLPDDTLINDIRNPFGGNDWRTRRYGLKAKGPYAEKWEEVYSTLSSTQQGFISRTFNWMRRESVMTLGDLRSMSEKDIIKTRYGLGIKCATLLKAAVTPTEITT